MRFVVGICCALLYTCLLIGIASAQLPEQSPHPGAATPGGEWIPGRPASPGEVQGPFLGSPFAHPDHVPQPGENGQPPKYEEVPQFKYGIPGETASPSPTANRQEPTSLRGALRVSHEATLSLIFSSAIDGGVPNGFLRPSRPANMIPPERSFAGDVNRVRPIGSERAQPEN